MPSRGQAKLRRFVCRKAARTIVGGGMVLVSVLAVVGCGWLLSRADQNARAPDPAAMSSPAVKPQELTVNNAPARDGRAGALLLDSGESGSESVEKMADNSRCEVCHLNMAAEELTLKHARADVGCAKCHGECDAHIADESWASGGNGTAPDIMYSREKIAIGCMECHNAEQVFLKAEKHRPDAWLIAYEVKTCTECHGKHRLPSRKCKWK